MSLKEIEIFKVQATDTEEYSFKLCSVHFDEACTIKDQIQNDLFNIIWIKDGMSKYHIDFSIYDIDTECIFFLTPGQVFKVESEEIKIGYRLAFSLDFYCVETQGKETGCNGVLFNNIYEVPFINPNKSENGTAIIIPRKALNLLKATLPAESTNVSLEFNMANAFFKFDNLKMICRLIDEKYPDYENVIPVDNNNIMSIDRNEFLSSLKRIAIYANKTTHQVRLKITGSELQISAEDLDFSNEANERLSCEHDGEDIEIGFNARFLIEMLSNLESKEIELQLSASNKAGLIIPKEKGDTEDILMLVMPVMLSTYE